MNDQPSSNARWPVTETVGRLGVSPTLAINEESARLEAEGRDIYRLGLGQSPFPVPGEVVAELREHAGEKDYLPVRGLEGLREAVAGHHERTRRPSWPAGSCRRRASPSWRGPPSAGPSRCTSRRFFGPCPRRASSVITAILRADRASARSVLV